MMWWTFTYIALVVFPFVALVFAVFHGGRNNPLWASDPLECDTCRRFYDRDKEPEDSCQTYNGHWFCSDRCATQGGW